MILLSRTVNYSKHSMFCTWLDAKAQFDPRSDPRTSKVRQTVKKAPPTSHLAFRDGWTIASLLWDNSPSAVRRGPVGGDRRSIIDSPVLGRSRLVLITLPRLQKTQAPPIKSPKKHRKQPLTIRSLIWFTNGDVEKKLFTAEKILAVLYDSSRGKQENLEVTKYFG